MAEEGNSDLSMKFSTLNVNAMEFVPSFCSSLPPTASSTTDPNPDTPTETMTQEPKSCEVPASQDESPTKTDDEQPTSVAAPTESIDDKSPDNPGL